MRLVTQHHGFTTVFAIAIAGLTAGACAHAVPKELIDAREAYQKASTGPATELAPADVHKAKVSMDLAESAFADDPGGEWTRDLAYVAQRRSQLAEVLAMQAQDTRDKLSSEQALQAKQAAKQRETSKDLSAARRELLTGDLVHAQDVDKLEAERLARLTAEQRAAESEGKNRSLERKVAVTDEKNKSLEQQNAVAEEKNKDLEQKSAEQGEKNKSLEQRLNALAALKNEERGLVITLSGSVLFTSNESRLLPSAEARLDQISAALIEGGSRALLVEGFTDSRGKDGYNVDLSQRRADAVRSYIVSRGYPGERIRANGAGHDRPVASNSSAEGRANNRRVEIVVLPK